MVRCTAEERALARASLYRLLALAFSYPAGEDREAIGGALSVAEVAAELLDEGTVRGVAAVQAAFDATDATTLEHDYQRVLSLSYSEECPVYETAFSASHIFQQTAQQADISGFYHAFGVKSHGDRPDHLAMELEFSYLLALKEAHSRSSQTPEHVSTCRDATRAFLRKHLARWSPLIGQRVVVEGSGTFYEAAGRLLLAFMRYEEKFLRLGRVQRYRDEPVLIADEPGDFECPMDESGQPVDLPLLEANEEGQYVPTLT